MLAWLVLLLAALAAGTSTAAGTGGPASHPPHGPVAPISWEVLQELHHSNPKETAAAYKACTTQFGTSCKVPCNSIANCAGCHPSSKGNATSVCSYCMPGYVLAADQQSCTACPVGTTSKGGKSASCSKCPAGQTTLRAGAPDCIKELQPNKEQPPRDTNVSVSKPPSNATPGRQEAQCAMPPDVYDDGFTRTEGGIACPEAGGLADSGAICTQTCYQGSYGYSAAYCLNGAWGLYYNYCHESLCREDTCIQNGIYTAICRHEGLPKCSCGHAQLMYREGYGCTSGLVPAAAAYIARRCALRLTADNPMHVDTCEASPIQFDTSNTRCTQVSLETRYVPGNCKLGAECEGKQKWCWAQIYDPLPSDVSDEDVTPLPGFIRTGTDCATDPNSLLGPCPSPDCRIAPSSEQCKVESTDGLTMRTAPCAAAPAIQQDGQDIIIPQGASFKYLDRNSRQSDDCRSYGLWLGLESFCWVLGSYAGTTGWVPVQTLPTIQGFTSGLCTYTASDVPTLLVSDGGSSTGCAQLTPGGPQCFPADAVVTLRNGDRIRMSQLDLGAEIAVRNADGSVGYDAVYAFGHRDDHTVTSFVELVAELAGDATRSIQATADHFLLVGAHLPTYKRAGDIAPGDVMWAAAAAVEGASLTPATVISSRTVTNTGLYAPLTLGGSIIVNGMAASVHSTWFADGVWSALGLPDAWLHHLYQAVLAPVRLLWYSWPNYKAYYVFLDETLDVASTGATLSGLMTLTGKALKHMAGETLGALQQTVLEVLAQLTDTRGLATVLSEVLPVLAGALSYAVVLCSCCGLVSSVKGPSVGNRARPTKAVYSLAPLVLLCLVVSASAQEQYDNEHPDAYGIVYRHKRSDHASDSYDLGYRHETDDDHGAHYRYRHEGDSSYGHNYHETKKGLCEVPPSVSLPNGKWACGNYGWVPVGGKCAAKCDGAGEAEITCTSDGWDTAYTGKCLPGPQGPKVCEGLPTADAGPYGSWPANCANTPVGQFCYAKCTGVACRRDGWPAVVCTDDGWGAYASGWTYIYINAAVCNVNPACEIPPDDTSIPNGFWSDECRELGLAVGDSCPGVCLGMQGAGGPPMLECTESGIVIKENGGCLPL